MRSSYDVVVIGSGFGGAIVGCRLAQAGRSVCILEKGRRWERFDYPRSPAQIAGALWDSDKGSFGLLEYRAFRRMHVIQGTGMGGGSLHYFNVHVRPPASIFEDRRWPAGTKLPVLEPYYDLAKDMLDAAPLTPPEGRSMPPRTMVFLDAGKAVNANPRLMDIAVYTGPPRRNPHGGAPQGPCDYEGNCLIGCQALAKNSLDRNYLPLAERYGAEVYPLHEVDRIEPTGEGGYRVHFRRDDPAGGGRFERGTVMATAVVLAAGALGSTELLLRARNRQGTLKGISPALGRGFSGNGDLLLAGTLTDRVVDASQGPSITARADFPSKSGGVVVEDLGFPQSMMWLLEGMLLNSAPAKNLLRWLKIYLQGILGIGGATKRLTTEWRYVFQGRTSGFLPYLGMCADAADGRLRLDGDGNVLIDWSHRRSRKSIRELERALEVLSRALDGYYVPSPLWAWPQRKLLTAHPLGGCNMADDPKRGVVSEYGEVYGYWNLFVVDASIIPTSLLANPSATISALAERAAFHMLHRRELNHGDPATPSNSLPQTDDVSVGGGFPPQQVEQ